jgi:hypothetical protein
MGVYMGDLPTMSKQTFEELPDKNKLDIMFDYIVDIHERVDKTESRKIKNAIYSTLSGCVGGAIAFLSSKLGGII